MDVKEVPIPEHFDPEKVGDVWRVDYADKAVKAEQWAKTHRIQRAGKDRFKLCLLLVDVQNTFCIPGYELYVAGRSGTGAVDDNVRLCRFIYRYLHAISETVPTMDTHYPIQVFHNIFLVNDKGEHPAPLTIVTEADIEQGRWRFNEKLADTLNITPEYGQQYLNHYVRQLKASGKYEYIIWPYHAMIGGIGHALVPAVEEALFFHSIARGTQPDYHVKGENPFTEHYSVLGPEVTRDPQGRQLAEKNEKILNKLIENDAVVIAGQAKSHCVAWTISDLLDDVMAYDRGLVEKVYILEDCTSPVVVPDVVDYTDESDEIFKRFAEAGMHLVKSTDSISQWPGM
ncbi:MAG: isochorismatase [Desulfobacterales bacterium]